jgi:hypothetical protein
MEKLISDSCHKKFFGHFHHHLCRLCVTRNPQKKTGILRTILCYCVLNSRFRSQLEECSCSEYRSSTVHEDTGE